MLIDYDHSVWGEYTSKLREAVSVIINFASCLHVLHLSKMMDENVYGFI